MNIHESAEDYLEAILRLRETKGYVRSVDISLLLGVTKPSVSFAMKKLRENNYILMDEDSLITLTEKGEEIARRVYDRHKTLMSFLVAIGVSEETAREDACKIEHDISQESFEALQRQLVLLKTQQ
ncbi:MAG: metal-dependent transcriptional regulator [Clostridia bacterium]|nr:metal-dependent transcriptional regulator [Clostridia bacterium]